MEKKRKIGRGRRRLPSGAMKALREVTILFIIIGEACEMSFLELRIGRRRGSRICRSSVWIRTRVGADNGGSTRRVRSRRGRMAATMRQCFRGGGGRRKGRGVSMSSRVESRGEDAEGEGLDLAFPEQVPPHALSHLVREHVSARGARREGLGEGFGPGGLGGDAGEGMESDGLGVGAGAAGQPALLLRSTALPHPALFDLLRL